MDPEEDADRARARTQRCSAMMLLPTGNCDLARFSIRGHSTLVRWVGIYRRDGARGFESQAELGDQLADYILWHNEARDQSSAGQPQSGRVPARARHRPDGQSSPLA